MKNLNKRSFLKKFVVGTLVATMMFGSISTMASVSEIPTADILSSRNGALWRVIGVQFEVYE